jgi:peptide/nickel transport system substrate-binding protein
MLLALLLTACTKQTGASGKDSTIRYGIPTEPDHLDPYEATSADSRFILFNVFEGLFKPSSDGRLIPAVASAYTSSPDFLKWTITLKDNVVFHNGKKVTANDVVYSLNSAAEKQLYGMQAISRITIANLTTIVIDLAQADPEFYYYLTNAIIPAGYEKQNEFPIGTGPFKFVSFTPQSELVLTKHAEYWNPELPKSDGIVFKIKANYNAVMLDLRAGSLDSGTTDSTSVQQLKKTDFNIVYENINAVQIFCLNNAYEPLKDVRVRQAISYVVDSEEIMKLAHNGNATRASTPIIPALSYAYDNTNDSAYKKNTDKAKALINQAGYENGFSLEITVPSVYQPHVETAQVIINQLATIGIRATIKQVDWLTWLSDVYTNRKYQATVISIDGVTLSPRSYLFRYETTEAQNFMNYSNAEFDALYKKTLQTANETERVQAYKAMQQILSKDAASVFICDLSAPRVFKKNITGLQSYPLYVFDASTLTVK